MVVSHIWSIRFYEVETRSDSIYVIKINTCIRINWFIYFISGKLQQLVENGSMNLYQIMERRKPVQNSMYLQQRNCSREISSDLGQYQVSRTRTCCILYQAHECLTRVKYPCYQLVHNLSLAQCCLFLSP